jgi:DNA helicase-2/ATP-dependent DNA helicase PcrA
MVEILAQPQDNLCVVGDDDQTIYAWRRADVRRMLDFPSRHPGCRRIVLATNYRCPPEIVRAASRLVAVNQERVPKRILAVGRISGPRRIRTWHLRGPDGPDQLAARLATWAGTDHSVAVLARTRTGLGPYLMAFLRAGIPHATAVPAPIESPAVVALVAELRAATAHAPPFHALMALRTGRGWRRSDPDDSLADEDHDALDAALGWATWHRRVDTYLAAHDAALDRLRRLRDPGAPIELTTIHGSKGREWDTVAVVGLEADGLPNRRSIVRSDGPARALEEERRLAYVAVTRARQRLILAYDPARPSPFLTEMASGRADAILPVKPATARPRVRQPTGS